MGLALTLTGHAAFAGPGTQTEDDVYVGNKRQAQRSTTAAGTSATAPGPAKTTSTTPKALLPGTVASPKPPIGVGAVARPLQGATSPGTAAPQPRPGAGVSPNTSALVTKKTALSGGDDDLDDLEVERRTVQGVKTPTTTAPQVRPGAGTSPNTGRGATPTPSALPGKP